MKMTDIAERLMKISGFIGEFSVKFESNSKVESIEDFDKIFQKLLEPNVDKYASITLRSMDDNYVGGIDFLVVTPAIQSSNIWCWPLSDRRDHVVHERPRYNNLFDAALASIMEHDGDEIVVGCWASDMQGRRMGESKVIIEVSSFFDNEDYLEEGTVKRWWLDQIDKLQFKTETVKWRGSDDPMTHY